MPRPRKPSLIRQLEGNRSFRPIPEDLPPDGVPRPSDAIRALGKDAVRDWRRLVKQVGTALLRQQDGRLLELAVLLRHHLLSAHREGDRRFVVQLSGRYQQVLKQLGIGPGERVKYTPPMSDKDDDDLLG
jgi:hypothetical protein